MELSGLAKAQFLSVNMAFGFAVTAGAYVSAGVSGAHLNPAVSLAMFLVKKLTWRLLLVYCVAQFLGAFFGAALVFFLYFDALHVYSGGNWTVTGPQATAGIFASYPSEHLGVINGFTDQVIATAALLICIMAVLDEKNNAAPVGMQPFVIGLMVLLVGLAMGFNCGYPINPARDFGPRLFTAMAGWGIEVFTYSKDLPGAGLPFHRAGNHWWWVPVIGPLVGGMLGALAYQVFVEIHHERDSKTEGPPEAASDGKNGCTQYELVDTAA